LGVVDVVDIVREPGSPWSSSGAWQWVLVDLRPLEVPFPVKGHLELLDVALAPV